MGLRIDLVENGKIAVKSLTGNRMRTGLTTVGIGVGVCTLIAIVGIIQGLNGSVARQLSSLGTNTLYLSKMPWVVMGDWWEYRNRRNLTPKDADALREDIPEIEAVAPLQARSGDVSFLGHPLSRVEIDGTTEDFPRVGGFEVVGGRFLTGADNENASSVVVLGADVASGLFSQVNPLGMSVRVDGQPCRVIGVLGRKGKVLGESQDLAVYVPLKTYLSHFGRRWPFNIAVLLKENTDLKRAQEKIETLMRRRRGLSADKPNDFSVNKPEALARVYNQLTQALYGAAVGIGLITLLVGGIGIMNVMLVSVRERTREIGVRRALGARRRTIILQFLMEAAAVSAVGGAVGTVLGLTFAKGVDLLTPLAAAVQPVTAAGGVLFAACVGILFGLWPAVRAANLDPVEALRHE